MAPLGLISALVLLSFCQAVAAISASTVALEQGQLVLVHNSSTGWGYIRLPGLEPPGATLAAGAANIQPSMDACLRSCLAAPGCNALAYCDSQQGCPASAAASLAAAPVGACELQRQEQSAPGTGRPVLAAEAAGWVGGVPILLAPEAAVGFDMYEGAMPSDEESWASFPCNGSLSGAACVLSGSAAQLAPLCLADPDCSGMVHYPLGSADYAAAGPNVTVFLGAGEAGLNTSQAVFNANAVLYLRLSGLPGAGAADPRVCGLDGVTTFPSAAAAALAGAEVLHCGPCGACSTQQDAEVYRSTASNLTVSVRACGFAADRDSCLAGVGFTPGCAACFAANIDCDAQSCLQPCLAALALGGEGANSLGGNKCLACDEAQCGPAFKACAGANRRRLGIRSDIARDEAELCTAGIFYQAGD